MGGRGAANDAADDASEAVADVSCRSSYRYTVRFGFGIASPVSIARDTQPGRSCPLDTRLVCNRRGP